jgi:ubiquinone/menaquinone biosynthesis C-methylase UbiE
MRYVDAPSEAIPFPDGHFDVVSSFNSLDHVDDLDRTVAEIVRVLRPGGRFLLVTEVGHDPTPTEPISFSWDVVERFAPALQVVREQRFDKDEGGVYQSLLAGRPPRDPACGVLSVLLVKEAS